MTISLPPLPFERNALAPHISEETIEYHYGKHHKAYVDNLNKLLPETNLGGKSLEEIIMNSNGGVFNNAAQVWNHTFYWHCLSPNGGRQPQGNLGKALEKEFGSFDNFKEKFTKTAIGTFGSGWAWLVKKENGGLDIVSTSNAQTPMTSNQKALLTCDVWEHAYYIDYRNARPKYVEHFWELVNWDFVSSNF